MVGVLLAAGAGRRLGLGPKALLSFGGQEPQVARMMQALWDGGCQEVVVVLGAEGGRVRGALGPGLHHVVLNDAWETGMGSSFRAGVAAAGQLLGNRGGTVMITLVDQPGIEAQVIARLRAAASTSRVTAAGYPDPAGRLIRGHPIIFPVALAREAAAMAEGDAGGRAWLRGNPGLIDLIDLGSLATGCDIDTAADLEHWRRTTGVADDTA